MEFATQIQRAILGVLDSKFKLSILTVEVTSTVPLVFKVDDRRTIDEDEVTFLDTVNPVKMVIDSTRMTPERIAFTGCKGHGADETGIGTSGDFIIEQVKERYSYYIQRPLEVGDKCVLLKFNDSCVYLGRVGNPYEEIIIEGDVEHERVVS